MPPHPKNRLRRHRNRRRAQGGDYRSYLETSGQKRTSNDGAQRQQVLRNESIFDEVIYGRELEASKALDGLTLLRQG
jgi:hypothetical protein